MNIIIPMAGMGKRLRPHTLTTPKPLLPIAGKPMVQHIVEDIVATSNEKVEEIAFVINPAFGKEVEAHLCAVAEALGARGKIAYQQQPLGTAHAILAAAETLSGPVFIAFSDTLFKANFKIDANKDAIIWTQKVADPSAFGVVKLSTGNKIEAFVEKPKEFVSDQAIIGVYYFKDGENLRRELQRLLDLDIKHGGEYQITDAMEHMLQNGLPFYTDQVEEWLDCGNYAATVYTAGRVLNIRAAAGVPLIAASARSEHSVVIPPCYLGENVLIKNSVVGPNVSIESGAVIEDSRLSNSIIGEGSVIRQAILNGSLLGKFVNYSGKPQELSLGDFSSQS
ncbi:MAG: NTP transferase domain-containing protein [Bacteroidetes bacterium]|nr:NTP transferase domain-containing protein [Bacteroidota bacterium]